MGDPAVKSKRMCELVGVYFGASVCLLLLFIDVVEMVVVLVLELAVVEGAVQVAGVEPER